MSRILAIARLTFWEGIRMRIVLVFVLVLVFIVLRLPFALRGDETLAGRLQTFLSYSLGAVSIFLSLATVFLSCATLSNEIKSCSIHLVVTKPVTRFHILAGKWLGVNILNVLLVLLCGATIYGFAAFIKNRPEQFQRDRLKVDQVVWTARINASPTVPDFDEPAEQRVQQLIRDGQVLEEGKAPAVAEMKRRLLEEWRVIMPGRQRAYVFENLVPPRSPDEVVQFRFTARGSPLPLNEEVRIVWVLLDPESGRPLDTVLTAERSATTHEFLVRGQPIIKDRRAVVVVHNPLIVDSRTAIHFDGAESLQLMYRVGGFEANYAKALLMIVFRLGFLSAVGLLFGTFVSFPVASLCSVAAFLLCWARPWWLESIGANMEIWSATIDPYGVWGPYIRPPVEALMRTFFPDFARYDGGPRLVDGEFISAMLLGECAAATVLVRGGLLLLLGWLIFRKREIAQVTV